MEKAQPRAVCVEEALNLLNCVTESPYEQDKCLRLLQALRECVLNKKVTKFSLADQDQKEANSVSNKA